MSPMQFGTGSTFGGKTCENCGGHVTARYARVFGDNRDRIFGCPSCMSSAELREGRATHGYEGHLRDAGEF